MKRRIHGRGVSFATVLFTLGTLGALGAAGPGCGQDKPDPPEVAQRKQACKVLHEHLFRISPQSGLAGLSEAEQQKKLAQLQAGVPIEDIEQCAAADPKVVACMQQAADVAAVKACIPAPKE
jgi:hypothetical protein